MTNPLESYFQQHQGRRINKWMHYFEVYHRHLQKFRGRPVTVVEFGVQFGGSAQMWREYFGPDARIYGVDIDPRCKAWEEPGFTVFIGDQADRRFLRRIGKKIGPIDVVIDDGGHFPAQQIATFEEMYPLVKPGGVFLIEDLHTNYRRSYGGGLGVPGTFMEYAKPLTDQLNAYHSREPGFVVDDFTRTTRSMHYYDSIIVFEKDRVTKPVPQKRGVESWDPAKHIPIGVTRSSRLRTIAVRARSRVAPRARRAVAALPHRRARSRSAGR